MGVSTAALAPEGHISLPYWTVSMAALCLRRHDLNLPRLYTHKHPCKNSLEQKGGALLARFAEMQETPQGYYLLCVRISALSYLLMPLILTTLSDRYYYYLHFSEGEPRYREIK